MAVRLGSYRWHAHLGAAVAASLLAAGCARTPAVPRADGAGPAPRGSAGGPSASSGSAGPTADVLPGGAPRVRFEDETAAAGIRFRHHNGAFGRRYMIETMGPGCAVFDFDGDGDLDL